MRIIIDANVVISALLGRHDPITPLLASGAAVFLPEAQAAEVADVLLRKFGISEALTYQTLDRMLEEIGSVTTAALRPAEQAARKRLDESGQRDWPVLAAALELDADIWSNDRDFFGVGVAVWKTSNIPAAIEMMA